MANCKPENGKVKERIAIQRDYKVNGRVACSEPCAINFLDISNRHGLYNSPKYGTINIVMGDKNVVIKASNMHDKVSGVVKE